MQLRDYLNLLTEYNAWAHHTLAEFLTRQDEEVISRHIESSFPSLRKTILHICDAEALWLHRLQGISLDTFPSKSFHGNSKQVIELLEQSGITFMDYVSIISDAQFEEVIKYQTTGGNQYKHTAAEMIIHCMNHSTYHRGQIITIGRQTGMINLPATDFIHFLRVRQSS